MIFRNALLRKQASPEVARFNGMVFRVFYNDHEPPHFHVKIGGNEYSLNIWDLKPTPGEKGGQLSSTYVSQIGDWFRMPVGGEKTVQNLMHDNWLLARNGQPVVKVPTPQELKSKAKRGVASAHGIYAIRHAAPVKPFSLRIEFDSGERKLVDVKAMRGHNRRFAKLWDWGEFEKVRFEPNAVLWGRGLNELEIEDQDLWAAGIPC